MRFKAEAEKTRICSLAAGKLSVEFDEGTEFTIGPHGLFKIKPGVACSVQNRLYIDAILHMSTVLEDL